jgi:hypothetical protein
MIGKGREGSNSDKGKWKKKKNIKEEKRGGKRM